MEHRLMQHIQLPSNWQCKKRTPTHSLIDDSSSTSGWFTASVPGTVHQALLATDQIPDPFYGRNEALVQWVGESDWLYRCTFELPTEATAEDCVALCFDGLDTFATVWLNGQQIHTSDNMFIPYRVQIASYLYAGKNELLILFESALLGGKKREEIHGKQAVWNGDASRVYVRKAQYHYGWDWGPILLTAGPWRPMHIETYRARIADFYCPIDVTLDLEHASIQANVTCELGYTVQPGDTLVQLALYAPDGECIDEQVLPIIGNTMQHTFELDAPQLWWPRGYGEQSLYSVVATMHSSTGEELNRQERRLGLRRLQLVQQPLVEESGTTFFFAVNNTPIYCGGANWIPADSFLPAISPERYRAWLQLAADAHMTMVRIWGGGIYEEDVFYDTCDELGLLVWQDFMFGCGIYPALDWFQKSVQAEAEATIRRLRHHPSIALWCGNNEDYLLAQSLGSYDSSYKGDFTTTAFPARALYEQLLPAVCAQLDPTRPYWPGSPYSGQNANDISQGDAHVWDIWQKSIPYQDYPKTPARFVSEFGIESFPALATIESITPPEERYPQSHTLDAHNKSDGGQRLLAGYIVDNIRMPTDLADYIYASQFIQAEAMAVAIRGWRRYWGHTDTQTGGALLWQLNDCWPVTSWAIVDYMLRPKAAYYVVRRELAPFAVGLAPAHSTYAKLWVVNGITTSIDANVEVCTWTLDGKLVAEEHRAVTLAPNQGTELGHVRQQDTHVISARLLKDGVTIARTALWPEPFKYLSLAEPEITVERLDTQMLRVQAKRPAKGVWLSAEDDVQWSDNMLDLFPNDPHIIKAQGLGFTEVQVRWLT